jgi:hypothetical protein
MGMRAVARQLSGSVGTELANAARTAFIQGLRMFAAISAVGSFALAIFVVTVLRRDASRTSAELSP